MRPAIINRAPLHPNSNTSSSRITGNTEAPHPEPKNIPDQEPKNGVVHTDKNKLKRVSFSTTELRRLYDTEDDNKDKRIVNILKGIFKNKKFMCLERTVTIPPIPSPYPQAATKFKLNDDPD
jgi:hypothetical protein